MVKRKLQVVVIGVKKTLRNPNLESQLVDFDVTYIKPVIVLDRERIEPESARVANRQILGRDLLNAEIGCALAHESARASIKNDWGLILEDDAQIDSETIHLVAHLVSQKTFTLPAVITLVDHNQTSVRRLKIERLNHMPGTTTAYLASKSVTNLDESPYSRIGTADWPLSFLGANFYAIRGTGVSEFDSVSTIHDSKNRGTSAKNHYKNALINLIPVFRLFGKDGIKYSLLLPLLRDIANRKRGAKKIALGWAGILENRRIE